MKKFFKNAVSVLECALLLAVYCVIYGIVIYNCSTLYRDGHVYIASCHIPIAAFCVHCSVQSICKYANRNANRKK